MGIVAGITLSLLKRQVLHVAACLEVCWFMALVTELAAFVGGRERRLGGWRVVALLAGHLDHLGMHACLQKVGLQGRVGIMAAITGRGLHRIACMCFFESYLITFVAGQTKGDIVRLKEVGFIGAMGKVAGVARLFY